MSYFRPLIRQGEIRPDGAYPLAGTDMWFSRAEVLQRGHAPALVPATKVPGAVLDRLTAPRAAIAGLDMGQPQLMGILNVTPDSFSDGGQHNTADAAHLAALEMVDAGAGMIDIGGESTRPGADFVPEDDEIARTAPVIAALRRTSDVPISIDTRKAAVALAALGAGASLVNDVSGFTFDAALAPLCADQGVPVCVMHAQGDPATMQTNPVYDNVLLDVFDYLSDRVRALERAGIARDRIVVDPGIGFGKTQAHNLTLLRNIGLFHGLGCAVLLGASRKTVYWHDRRSAAGRRPRAPGPSP